MSGHNGRPTIAGPDIALETSAPGGHLLARGRPEAASALTVPEIPSAPEVPYGAGFFEAPAEGTRRSAAIVTPILIELFRPASVVDVGCGTGLWLSAFRQHGVADIQGVDGPWIPSAQLEIRATLLHQHDLSRPLELGRTFDLALSWRSPSIFRRRRRSRWSRA